MLKKNRKTRIFLFAVIIIVIVACVAIFAADAAIRNAAKGKIYTNVQDIPFNKVGLLLGTSKYLPNGYVNYFYKYRIDAAAELMKNGKIRYLVISGDNSRKDYNEPEMMRQDLIQSGIDSNLIFLDYAGFRTFDSIVRLREIFSQNSVTVISQQFHNERAIFIASKQDIDAIGFDAKDVTGNAGLGIRLREKLARVKVFIDYLTNKKPHFLGPKVLIP